MDHGRWMGLVPLKKSILVETADLNVYFTAISRLFLQHSSLLSIFTRRFATTETNLYFATWTWPLINTSVQCFLTALPYNNTYLCIYCIYIYTVYIQIQYAVYSTSASGLIQYLSYCSSSINSGVPCSCERVQLALGCTSILWIRKPVRTATIFWMQTPPL